MRTRQWVSALVVGAATSALFWIDPIFIPLALLGPLVIGAVAGARGLPWLWAAATMAVAGLGAVVSDWLVNEEDVAFHLALTVIMVGLASAAWWVTRRLRRGQSHATA